jgi:hypothetical protein
VFTYGRLPLETIKQTTQKILNKILKLLLRQTAKNPYDTESLFSEVKQAVNTGTGNLTNK